MNRFVTTHASVLVTEIFRHASRYYRITIPSSISTQLFQEVSSVVKYMLKGGTVTLIYKSKNTLLR